MTSTDQATWHRPTPCVVDYSCGGCQWPQLSSSGSDLVTGSLALFEVVQDAEMMLT